MTKSTSVVESRFTDCRNVTIKSEMFVEGDTKGFDTVRQWNNGASNIDAWEGWVIAKFLSGAESDGFRLVTIKGKTVVGEPRVECSEAKLEMTKTGLEGVGSG